MRRLAILAQALSRDGLRANARKDAYRVLFGKLDGLLAQHKRKVADASNGILQVEGETLVVRVVGGEVSDEGLFVEAADELSVEADFRAAGRVITRDLARQYADHLTEDDEDEDGLFDAHVRVAALAKVEGVADELDLEADRLCGKWFDDYRVAIKGLSDDLDRHRRHHMSCTFGCTRIQDTDTKAEATWTKHSGRRKVVTSSNRRKGIGRNSVWSSSGTTGNNGRTSGSTASTSAKRQLCSGIRSR